MNSLAQSSQLARHPKQKGKYSAAVKKYGTKKPRRSAATFQKKLYVFQNMGPDAPDKFTRSDKNICLNGLLPPISVEASESEIWEEICALIHSGYCSTHMEISPTDFEFINMSGKQASVACCKENFVNGMVVRLESLVDQEVFMFALLNLLISKKFKLFPVMTMMCLCL